MSPFHTAYTVRPRALSDLQLISECTAMSELVEEDSRAELHHILPEPVNRRRTQKEKRRGKGVAKRRQRQPQSRCCSPVPRLFHLTASPVLEKSGSSEALTLSRRSGKWPTNSSCAIYTNTATANGGHVRLLSVFSV